MKNIKYSYAPAIVWGIFIFVLSVWPGKDFPSIPDWGSLLSLDKIVHITFYGLLTWLILWGKRRNMAHPDSVGTEGVVSFLFVFVIASFSSGFGWFLEWFQGTYCQDRMSDVMDGIANTIGAVIGLLAFRRNTNFSS
jgi:VanZ family protein